MSAGLDPRQVRRAFGRAAARYEANAVLQAEIGRLCANSSTPRWSRS